MSRIAGRFARYEPRLRAGRLVTVSWRAVRSRWRRRKARLLQLMPRMVSTLVWRSGWPGGKTPAPQSAQQVVWWRRRGAVIAVAAAVAVSVLILTVGRLDAGDGSREDVSQGQSYPEYIACARMIAEGDVIAVREAPQKGRVLVTFEVQDWIKPTQGEPRVELNLVKPDRESLNEPWRTGQHVLIVVPVRRDLETDAASGRDLTDLRATIEHYQPRAKNTECPPYWKHPQN